MMFQPLDVSKTELSKDVIEKIKKCIMNFSEIEIVVIYGSRAKGILETDQTLICVS
ncbi:MAG: hypothetical protein KDD34_09530 [Bdellovibrionales bacterium]|nr:hypothetical protein [Bdellovibrionales bacterium]